MRGAVPYPTYHLTRVQTRRDAERTAERLQSEKERLGWDVHLVTKRLETVQQESVGGDRQENAGVRSGLLAQAAVSVSSSLHAPSGTPTCSNDPGGLEGRDGAFWRLRGLFGVGGWPFGGLPGSMGGGLSV